MPQFLRTLLIGSAIPSQRNHPLESCNQSRLDVLDNHRQSCWCNCDYVLKVTNVLKENNYPNKSFLYDCLRRPTLTDCNSSEGDSTVKGFVIVRKECSYNNCVIKVALKFFRTLGHIFAKPKVAFRLIGKHMLYS